MGVRSRVLLGACAAVLLAGCAGGGADSGETASPPLPSYSGTADGVIDHVIGATDLVDLAPHGIVQSIAVDATGAPVVFAEGASAVDSSVLARVAADGSRTGVPVQADEYADDVEVAPDGSLVATSHGQEDDVVTVARAAGSVSGTQTAIDVDGQFGLGSERPTALSPDGATIYLPVSVRYTDVTSLLAVDVATGTVKARATLQPGDNPFGGIRVTTDGSVLAGVNVALGQDRYTAVLERFDANLRPLGVVPLVPDQGDSHVGDLVVGPDGTSWVTVLDDTAAPARFELQTIPPGAAAPTIVAGWDAKDWDVPLSGSRGLVVDAATGTAYVLNPPGTDDLDASVVPVTLATGAIATTIAVDKDVIEVSMALSPDGRELYLADTHTGAAAKAPGDPILWTLG